MRPKLLLIVTAAVIVYSFQKIAAQNISPYWSLAGNSNATSSSKLGTTNAINLRILTNNLERMRITSSGNVGIGTTAVSGKLNINSAKDSNALRVQVNSSTKLLVHSGGGVSIGASVTPPANGLYVSGNVGIRSTTPAATLDILGGKWDVAGTEGDVRIGNSTYRLKIGVATGGGGAGDARIRAVGGTNRLMLGVSDALTISSTGNIGIGTTAPAYKLDVVGTIHGEQPYSSFEAGVHGVGFYGIYGFSNAPSNYFNAYGVRGTGPNGVIGISSAGGYGVYGKSALGVGVYGTSEGENFAGYFDGDVYMSGSFGPSDRKLKQNITDLGRAIDLINKLQPKEYEYRQDDNFKLMNLPKGKHYGLIAQDLEQVLPTLTKETNFDTRIAHSMEKEGNNPSQPSEVISFKAVNYTELIPIIIKGMQEQELRIQQQDAKIDALTRLVNQLQNSHPEASVKLSGVSLGQNIPNPPGGNNTTISYSIPSNATSAQLIFTDAAGRKIKQVQLNSSGVVDINTSSLKAGAYFYTLYVNGKTFDTKKTIVSR